MPAPPSTGFDIGTSTFPNFPWQRTFTVDGVQYTVSTVGYQKTGGLIGFHLEIQPAIPFDFTLTLGATPIEVQQRKLSKWLQRGHPVPMGWNNRPELGKRGHGQRGTRMIPLIDICGRSSRP